MVKTIVEMLSVVPDDSQETELNTELYTTQKSFASPNFYQNL